MKAHLPSALLAAALLAAPATAAQWRVTALDPLHLAVQCDRTDDERAAFALTDKDRSQTGWKFDNAFYAAADRATAGRADFEAALRAGPFEVAGSKVASHALWKSPNGLLRFPDNKGFEKSTRNAKILWTVFLALEDPMEPGAKATVTTPTGETLDFTYDPAVPSPLFKVNQVGYATLAAKRYAYLGGWLGPLGPWPAPPDGKATFELVDAKTGQVALTGPVARRRDDPVREGTPFCGEETCEMDITAAPEGRYFLRVASVGRSMDFDVGREGIGDAFALHMKGLYQQRCGIEKSPELTRWPDKACHLQVFRGVNPPGQGKKFKTGHFAVNSAMMDSYTETLSLPGGWHDAADYDRRPMHLRIVGDLATIYLLRPENFADSQLAVPERGNGIPDVLDEAAWGLRHLIAAQQADGGVGTWIEGTRHTASRAPRGSRPSNTQATRRSSPARWRRRAARPRRRWPPSSARVRSARGTTPPTPSPRSTSR